MKKRKLEQLFGVPPEALTMYRNSGRDYFITHKSAKMGKSSFQITKALLDNLWATYEKIQKQPKLIISIPNGTEEYILSCDLTKNKVS